NKALGRGIDDTGTKHVGEPQRLDTRFTPSRDLDQRQLALDIGAFVGQIVHLAHRHEARELRLDLLDNHPRAGGDDGDPRQVRGLVDLGDRQALDIVAASGKQPDHARQDAGLVIDQNGDGMALDIGHAYTSTMPSSETGLLAASSGPSSISLWAAPEGIIGKQFSSSSTAMSITTAPGVSIMKRIASSRSAGSVTRMPWAPKASASLTKSGSAAV